MNWEVGEDGVCRCHGKWSPRRTSSGDIARITEEQACITQRIEVWLAVKKGERPLFPNFGCCIRSYINKPLTMSILKALKGEIQAELEDLFEEYEVYNLRVTVPERNTIKVQVNIGTVAVEFLGNAAALNELNSRLKAALSSLGMTSN